MNECTEFEMREMLPDVLHGSLGEADRGRIESHLARCSHCREELTVLRAVHAAAVFAPRIDTQRVVRQITPYGVVVTVAEPTVRKPALKWLVAAALAVVVAGGGSLLMRPSLPDASTPVSMAEPSFAVTADVGNLSDSELAQLITEMTEFDGLPAGDPDPVLEVDTPETLEQDSL